MAWLLALTLLWAVWLLLGAVVGIVALLLIIAWVKERVRRVAIFVSAARAKKKKKKK